MCNYERVWIQTIILLHISTVAFYFSSNENTDKRTWASTSNLSKDESKLFLQPSAAATKSALGGCWSSTSTIDNLVKKDSDSETGEKKQADPVNVIKQRPYTGSQSDSYTFRRFSNSLVMDEPVETDSSTTPQKLQIKSVKSVVDKNGENASSNTDVEFIIQVLIYNSIQLIYIGYEIFNFYYEFKIFLWTVPLFRISL